jgi:hypothetical protein
MLRLLYRGLLGLHPRRFRQRFGDEMLSIFDQTMINEVAGKLGALRLLGDGILSLFRQQVQRARYFEEPIGAGELNPAVNRAPVFQTLESFRPRASALIHGAIVSVVIFSAAVLAMKYSESHRIHLTIPLIGDATASSAPEFQSAIIPSIAPSTLSENRGEASVVPRSAATLTADTGPKKDARQSGLTLQANSNIRLERARQIPVFNPEPHTLALESAQKELGSTALTANPEASAGRGRDSWLRIVPLNLPENGLRSYVGVYTGKSSTQPKVLISLKDGLLSIDIAGRSRNLLAISGKEFVAADGTDLRIEFVETQAGTVSELEIYEDGLRTTVYPQ